MPSLRTKTAQQERLEKEAQGLERYVEKAEAKLASLYQQIEDLEDRRVK